MLATIAFGGWKLAGAGLTIANAQLAVGDPKKHPEFAGSVKCIEARDFWHEADVSPNPRQGYHYNRNAETYMEVGLAMGWAMADLLGKSNAGSHDLRAVKTMAPVGKAIAEAMVNSDAENRALMDARTLLEKGQTSGPLPEGMVVRIAACLGERDMKGSADRLPETLTETWEFALNQVHRVVFEYKKDKSTYQRIESRPFDSKGICKDLLEGKAIEIQSRKGKGPKVVLAGTPYQRGSRSIKVVWNGETILDLHETNGPAFDAYRESDARAFGCSYERLATQARAAFRTKADQAK